MYKVNSIVSKILRYKLQTVSHNVLSSTPRLGGIELNILVVLGTDSIDSYKSNYHTSTNKTDPHYITEILLKAVLNIFPHISEK
jgi:hypothetical protein